MKQLTIYEKPTCTTCRKVAKYLREAGIDFEKINYYIDPFSEKLLKSLLKKLNMKPSELLRKKESAYKEYIGENNSLTENEILQLMVKHPDLVQRPIVEKGDRAILARPPEKIKEILG